jgi:hypothetical protein
VIVGMKKKVVGCSEKSSKVASDLYLYVEAKDVSKCGVPQSSRSCVMRLVQGLSRQDIPLTVGPRG